ncbi:carbon storage regulator CsrA [Tissierella pigra]|uniref:Translational regulator CsrA n=1 Tax=Tissierella pigra TaxID=2607614 RepID=A0A6N7XUH1_9FIRM|nr:carbon storage regulator CsrA [Tissierella pigra]MBU5427809.1 carbon storage regulator CsrA [Tissierella pigra]MSU00135.1 carbon storage regulator CsrA [Tissierella pigra]
MLILTRKKGEALIIDRNIEIKIMEIEDGKIKLGIEAPKNIEILRKEIYKNVEEENLAAINNKSKIEDIKRLLGK